MFATYTSHLPTILQSLPTPLPAKNFTPIQLSLTTHFQIPVTSTKFRIYIPSFRYKNYIKSWFASKADEVPVKGMKNIYSYAKLILMQKKDYPSGTRWHQRGISSVIYSYLSLSLTIHQSMDVCISLSLSLSLSLYIYIYIYIYTNVITWF